MQDLYEQLIVKISDYFFQLESKLARPKKVRFRSFYVYRYSEKNIHEAMTLKLARIITSLKAIHLLNTAGFLQEQASLQRVHDELTEDIQFLACSIIFDSYTEHHDRYLESFYQEEVDELKETAKEKATLPRKKIRAYISSLHGDNPHAGIQASKDISRGYSGYIHSASVQIMELYYGNPPRFHVSGNTDSPLYDDHVNDLLNYLYRSVLSFALVAKAFGDEELFKEIYAYSKEFAINSGKPEMLTDNL